MTDKKITKEPVISGSACKCTVCGKVFGGENSFTMHRVGEYGKTPPERRCLTDEELHEMGMSQNNHTGRWGRKYSKK